MDDMGTFRIDVEIENLREPGDRRVLRSALVDTGAELSWFPKAVLEELHVERRKQWHFRQADGTVLVRWTGAVNLYVAETWTADEAVFGESGDLILLGARSLEGLNLRVEPVLKRLVDAGPAPAAVAAAPSNYI
jgi:predicted aspartyl protease